MNESATRVPPRAAPPVSTDDAIFDSLYAPAARECSGPIRDVSLKPSNAWRCIPLTRVDIAIAAVLLAAALLVRWPFIARGETLLHSDEAIVGLMAQDIAEGSRFPIFFYGQRYMGALEAYVIAAILPFVSDPINALRLGPACFFAALVVVHYLMLTRWFGRIGGIVGAMTLLAAPPALMQWTISARGGYVEVLLWGSVLWWMYGEWFASKAESHAKSGRLQPKAETNQRRRLAIFGFVLGSGMWINPAIAVFVAPIVVHAVLGRGLFNGFNKLTPTLPVALPLVGMGVVMIVTSVWAVWVEQGQVRHLVLLGMPRAWIAVFVVVMVSVMAWRWRRDPLKSAIGNQPSDITGHSFFPSLALRAGLWMRGALRDSTPFIFGTLVGLSPTFAYTLMQIGSGQAVEPTVPLGLRPLWTCGETIEYFIGGLRLLLAADVRPYTDLVCVGRARPDAAMPSQLAAVMPSADMLALGAMLSLSLLFVIGRRCELVELMRMRKNSCGPASIFVLALASVVGLFVLGGCTFNFATIRYLVPLLAVMPGLLAATAVSRTGRFAVAALLTAWSVGQFGFHSTLGRPHPLHAVADALKAERVPLVEAEILDAHLLSYLTGQQPRVAEFSAFWPRLSHYRHTQSKDGPSRYVVHAADVDWMSDWTRHGWPGPPPPETSRLLWPRLKQLLKDRPGDVLERRPLALGYELWTLARPLEMVKPCRGCSEPVVR